MNEDLLALHDPTVWRAAFRRLAFRTMELDTTTCVVWTGPTNDGYGVLGFQVDGRTVTVRAHRLAYRLMVGPIPDGLDLDHLCRERGCINEDHLQPVTRRTNLLRGRTIAARNAARTTCRYGHPLDGSTTLRTTGRTQRYCRTCKRGGDRHGQGEEEVRPRETRRGSMGA